MPCPLLDTLETQMSVLLPILQAFRREIGEAAANDVLCRALAEWRVSCAQKLGEGLEGNPVARFLECQRKLAPRIGDAVELEMLEETPLSVAFDIKRCAVAEYFKSLGESRLGYELVCRLDDTIAEQIGKGQVALSRTGTIMCGAIICDFRYALEP